MIFSFNWKITTFAVKISQTDFSTPKQQFYLSLMMVNKLFNALLACALACSATAHAGDEQLPVNLSLEARGDYQREYVKDKAVKDNCGFKGQFLNLKVSGNIGEYFDYSFRQRLNNTNFNSNFFDATDWLYIDFHPLKQATLSAGKQVVAIGGYEYDRAPIDLYFNSEFWNMVPCYDWGVSASYTFNNNRDNILFQFCESPFRTFYKHVDMYAYNLLWAGRHGMWSSLWSVNLMEWAQGKFINYIALGNRFDFTSKLALELDFMNRASSHQRFLCKNFSIMGELQYMPSSKVKVFAKATYDVNNSGNSSDLLVHDGTDLTRVGAGVEYYPLSSYDIRIHAVGSYCWGHNTNNDGMNVDNLTYVTVGITWKMPILPWNKLKKN